jgi:hypothetical protein
MRRARIFLDALVRGIALPLAWPLSWACYGVGHLSYLFIDRALRDGDSEEPGRIFKAGWRLYQGAVAWSYRVQEAVEVDGGIRLTWFPWGSPVEESTNVGDPK